MPKTSAKKARKSPKSFKTEDAFWKWNHFDTGPFTDIQDDNTGQIIGYTGYFRWSDGTIRDMPEKKEDR